VKILVVKLHALGDLVIHTSAFERIKGGFPDAKITLLTTDWAFPAVKGLPFFNKVIALPNELFFGNRLTSASGLTKLLLRLRNETFDVVISFHRSKGLNFYLNTIGKRGSRFYSYSDKDSRYTVKLDETKHSALNACELADLVIEQVAERNSTTASNEMRYHWNVSEIELNKADEVLGSHGIIPGKFAVIFPGGGANPNATAPERRWSTEGFAKLATWLQEQANLRVIASGSKNDYDVCAEVSSLSGKSIFNLAGKTDIRTTAAIIKRSRVVVTNDSAPLHISAAVGSLTVGIFGPTGAVYKLPPGDRNVGVSLGLPCSPCYYGAFKGCQFDTIRCMTELTHQKVIDVVDVLLNRFPELK